MNATGLEPKPRRKLWWLWWLFAVLAVTAGPGRAWYAYRTGPQRFYQRGLSALAANDLEALRVAAEGLRGLDRFAPHFHLLTGAALLRADQPGDALQELTLARGHPQTGPWAYALSGEACYRLRQIGEARELLTAAIRLDPELTDARRLLATLEAAFGAGEPSSKPGWPQDDHPERHGRS